MKIGIVAGIVIVTQLITVQAVSVVPSIQRPVFPFEGNYYQVLEFANPISWHDARDTAAAQVHSPAQDVLIPGRLATITSEEESQFIDILLPLSSTSNTSPRTRLWLGGFQSPGSNEPDQGWQWISGEPWDYTKWDVWEPNDAGGGEDFLNIKILAPGGNYGFWNDEVADVDPGIAGAHWALVEYAPTSVPEPQYTFLITSLISAISVVSVRLRRFKTQILPSK